MSTITISGELEERMHRFSDVIQAVIDEEVPYEACVEIVMNRGLDTMLAELLGNLDQAALLQLLLRLASRHPQDVFEFIGAGQHGEVLREQRENLKRQMGFAINERKS